jgi:TonB-dependent SusC/RagA subfamily outer membrane receptor
MMNRNKSPKWHSVKNISIFFVVFAIIAFSATFEKVAIAQANTNSEYQTPIQKEDNIISQQTVIPTIKDTSSIIGNQTQISSVEDIRRFIVEHLRCPISLNRELVLVQVSFTIEKSGTISNIKAYDKTEITAPIKQIEVVAYVPRQKTHAESSNKLDKSNGSVENKHNTGNLNSENILLFRNEVENCLKKLPTCPSGISGLRYTIPVLFTYDKTPGDKSTNDSTKSVEIRNVENDQAYKVKKNDPLPEGPIYFLNGEKISSSEVKSIPPSDILSINVLKDKSAIALYGDEGKNGAVLINTINKVNNSIQSYKEPVFIVVDQNASFQDGDLSKFQNSIETMLNSNLAGTSNDKKTKVFVQFTVDKTGTVGDVNISKSPVPNANQSIIQAILSSPKWKPALQDGKPVKQQFMMPLKISSEIHSAIRMIPKSLVITPNPASGNVEITIPEGNPEKKYEIYVVDGNGKIVLQDKKNGPKITISVLNLKTGIYHIIVNDNGNQCQGSLSVTH